MKQRSILCFMFFVVGVILKADRQINEMFFCIKRGDTKEHPIKRLSPKSALAIALNQVYSFPQKREHPQ